MPRLRLLFSLLFVITLQFADVQPAHALNKPFDHSAWDQFLKTFVNESGDVNYGAVMKDPSLLDAYVKKLGDIKYRSFKNWPREERLAVLLNAYHVGMIRLILKYYPVDNVQEVPGFWDLPAVSIGLASFSLNQLRESELIGSFRDEKIHAALSCGAKSCAPLSRDAFTGPRVEGQLYVLTRAFVNDDGKARINPGEKKIFLSRIYKWYGSDFKLDFGRADVDNRFSASENSVISFIAHYLDDPERAEYLAQGNYKIKYLPFDWSLNDWMVTSASEA